MNVTGDREICTNDEKALNTDTCKVYHKKASVHTALIALYLQLNNPPTLICPPTPHSLRN